MTVDIELLRPWIGQTESHIGPIEPASVQGLAALLDRDEAGLGIGDPLPACWHWLFAPGPAARQSLLGRDGHAQRGGFLPPVPLPRRMWAGSRIEFHQPLHVGATLHRTSTIADISARQGRSGSLIFVRVRHEIGDGGAPALVDLQDIVYREEQRLGAPAAAPQPAPSAPEFSRTVEPDAVLLFRYSALTHNSHRIHYDWPYATGVEGYPGLVVHGPLIATLLLDLLHRQDSNLCLASFDFRAVSPLFDNAPFQLCGRREAGSIRLWASNAEGALAMDATAVPA